MDAATKRSVMAALLKAERLDLARLVARTAVQAGRRQVVFLGNVGPNGAREWVVVQYRNRPNGNGEKVARVSVRQGAEPSAATELQWTEPSYLARYLQNVRHNLSRSGIVLLNRLKRDIPVAY